MPLLDHFRGPLAKREDWHSFHSYWACMIASELKSRLPTHFKARPTAQYNIEIDVATFEEQGLRTESAPRSGGGTVLLLSPQVTATRPKTQDIVEIKVWLQDDEKGRDLVGAIELVSPSNKDRPASRESFLNKIAALAEFGVGVIVVDIVTERHANFHDLLMERYDPNIESRWGAALYAVSYRGFRPEDEDKMDVWQAELSLGQALPTMPFWLKGGFGVEVDLEASYARTCAEFDLTIPT